MAEIEYDADHVKHSVGGMGGHLFRRCIHVGMCSLPWLYYGYGDQIGDQVDLERIQIAALCGILILAVEAIRLKIGFTVVGQREYERTQMSAMAWGAVSVSLVFVTLENWSGPQGSHAGWLAVPIILCLTFGDPAMGEARRYGMEPRQVFALGAVFCTLIWLACWHFFGTPWYLALLMGPLTTAAEWPKLKWIDDNATMTLIPLATILLLVPFL